MILVLLIFGPLISYAQVQQSFPVRTQRWFAEAREHYQKLEYDQAFSLLSRILERHPDHAAAWALKGYCHADLGQAEPVIESFSAAVGLDPEAYGALRLNLSEWLFNLGQYDAAAEYLAAYDQTYRRDDMAETWLHRSLGFALSQVRASDTHQVPERLDGSGLGADVYFPSLTADGKTLVFTSESTDAHTLRVQEDLYTAQLEGNRLSGLGALHLQVPSALNEGTQTLRQDGLLMIFTACNYPDSKGGCDLYMARKEGASWGQPVNLGYPVNSRYWESTPSLSPDGRMLIFSSNRPGGYGGMDLWYSFWDEQVRLWSEPQNAGGVINTAGNELAPFFHTDGRSLYYSSDSLTGMGNLDIFKTTRLALKEWSEPINLGYPVNTYANEYGITLPGSGTFAIFSSDRQEGRKRGLYRYALPEALRPAPMLVLQGRVLDSVSLTGVTARVEIVSLTDSLMQRVDSEQGSGFFMISLPAAESHLLSVRAPRYFYHSVLLAPHLAGDSASQLTILLRPLQAGSVQVLRHIYFDFDSAKLKAESAAEIQMLSSFMENHPDIRIEIIGHTDSLGREEYNIGLSLDRAAVIRQALIEKGVAADRIKAIGAGSLFPVADNRSPEGQALNRRTEFRIVSDHRQSR